VDPGARVVYVDNDPIVLAHARALLISTPEGATDCLQADLREVDRILTAAQETLDLSQPVGLMLVAVLQYVPDADDPHGITRLLLDALAPGSHLVLSHPAADIGAEEVAASMRVYNERAAAHADATPRTHADVTRFFDGTEILDPGVVQLPEWRPETDSGAGALPMWCGVGRKPL
jgi:SAM-dependent methyltransferase